MDMEMNAHAFEILSNGLYSNPIRAILRELCCNAWDAHIEAGREDTPFDLHLPNDLDPVFRLRDYGPGLSPEKIHNVYRRYFASTKQNSNDMTGHFGLGSKTPFAYTDKFTVRSYHQGTMTHYAMVRDNGIPTVVKVASGPTDHPDGLEILFEVEQKDFDNFSIEAASVLRPFVVKPKITGQDITIEDFGPSVLKGEGWRVSQSHDKIAVMGNVEYPLSNAPLDKMSLEARHALQLFLVVDFPLGSFKMTPSREAIHWTDFSINSINDRMEEVFGDIREQASKAVEQAASLWDARLLAYDVFFGKESLLKNVVVPSYRGSVLQRALAVNEKDTTAPVTLRKVFTKYNGRSTYGRTASAEKLFQFTPRSTAKFYILDFKSGLTRLQNYLVDHHPYGVDHFLLSSDSPQGLQEFLTRTGMKINGDVASAIFPDFKFPAHLLSQEGHLIPTSTLPVRDRATSGGSWKSPLAGTKSKEFVFTTSSTNANANALYWEEEEVDFDTGGVYVVISRWVPSGFNHSRELYGISQSLGNLGLFPKIIGVRGEKQAKKYKNQDQWETVEAYVSRVLVEAWENPKLRLAVEFFTDLSHEHEWNRSHSRQREVERIKTLCSDAASMKPELGDNHLITRWAEKMRKLQELRTQACAFDYLWRTMKMSSKVFVPRLPHGNGKVFSYAEVLADRYPLICHLSSSYDRDFSSFRASKHATMAQYVRDMDRLRALTQAANKGE